ncbi:MAG TPA: hypothetical protein VJ880_04825 [Allomuricauda sp.]|nr:hypothetical protein [Allomuricauda sp.]
MQKQSYTNSYDHYDEMMNAHKPTSRLFGFIPFRFNLLKTYMVVCMAAPMVVLFLVFSIGMVWVGVIFVIFVIFSIEYNRVYDYRDDVSLTCIQTQMCWESEIKNGVPQLPDAPDFIDQTDVDSIFDEALSENKKPPFFAYARSLFANSERQ